MSKHQTHQTLRIRFLNGRQTRTKHRKYCSMLLMWWQQWNLCEKAKPCQPTSLAAQCASASVTLYWIHDPRPETDFLCFLLCFVLSVCESITPCGLLTPSLHRARLSLTETDGNTTGCAQSIYFKSWSRQSGLLKGQLAVILKQGFRRCQASACLAVVYLLRRSPEDKLAVWFPISRLSGPKFPCMEEGVERFGDLIRGTLSASSQAQSTRRVSKEQLLTWGEDERAGVRAAARILKVRSHLQIFFGLEKFCLFFCYRVVKSMNPVWYTFCDFPHGCLSYTRFLAHILKHSSLQSGPRLGLFLTARMCDYRLPTLLKKLGFGCFPHKTAIVGSEVKFNCFHVPRWSKQSKKLF